MVARCEHFLNARHIRRLPWWDDAPATKPLADAMRAAYGATLGWDIGPMPNWHLAVTINQHLLYAF